LKKFCLSIVALIAVPAIAAGAPAKPYAVVKKPTTASAAAGVKAGAALESLAKSDLTKMNATMQKAEGLSYSSQIDFSVPSPNPPGFTTQHTDSQVTMVRPASVSIKTLDGAKLTSVLSSSGTNLVIYDAAAGTYSQASTTPDLPGMLVALGKTGSALFKAPSESAENLQEALGFPIRYLRNQFVILQAPPGATLHFSESSSKSSGKVVKEVVETLSTPQNGGIKLTFGIDPATDLPVSQEVQRVPTGSEPEITIVKETFSSMKALTAPTDSSTFAFAPPTTATLVNPAQPPSEPAPTEPATPAPLPAPAEPAAPVTPPAAAPAPAAPAASPGAPPL
jgi:hypothetical protein